MKRSIARLVVLGVAAMIALTAAPAQADPVRTLGFDPSATLAGAVRYRVLNNSGTNRQSIWIGAHGVDSDGNTVASPNSSIATWVASTAISVSYNPATGLSTTVAGASPSPVSSNLDLGQVNYLEITIRKNGSGNTLNLNSVSLQATATHALGNFIGAANPTRWKITGEDLTSGFTLNGTLQRAGSFGGGDSSYVQIDVGYLAPPDTEGPETSDVEVQPVPVILNGSATVTAYVDETNTGGNTISSAHYRVDGGAIVGMAAQDGGFDNVSENVEGSFTATDIGTREVCVHGTDSLLNVGEPTCQTFLVTYKFDGFFSPIDNGMVNVAKAGQAIPAKWRLTDANETPIEDPASFAGFFSYPVACDTLTGSIADSVEEYAAGSSGLQYTGDGYWQFNWKTPKEYANTCRAMYVLFDSGATSPVVVVQFKK